MMLAELAASKRLAILWTTECDTFKREKNFSNWLSEANFVCVLNEKVFIRTLFHCVALAESLTAQLSGQS